MQLANVIISGILLPCHASDQKDGDDDKHTRAYNLARQDSNKACAGMSRFSFDDGDLDLSLDLSDDGELLTLVQIERVDDAPFEPPDASPLLKQVGSQQTKSKNYVWKTVLKMWIPNCRFPFSFSHHNCVLFSII